MYFFNDTAPTEIYAGEDTLALHGALPICMLSIPSIDIIDLRSDTENGFYPYWHTTEDSLDKIDKNTLGAVGETVITYILK